MNQLVSQPLSQLDICSQASAVSQLATEFTSETSATALCDTTGKNNTWV